MLKTTLLAIAATAIALPVFAQSIDIDDDGWSRVEAKPAPTMTVDIDDDGWAMVSVPLVRSDRGGLPAEGQCTQLESSVGVDREACGTMNLSELTTMISDD